MIKEIIDMLKLSEHVGFSENIEIAKGKHELKSSAKEVWKQGIRYIKARQNGTKKNS